MNAVLPAALANALLAVPLAALAWTAGRTLNRPAVTHALWVLVLLKLLTPPLLEVPVIPSHLAPRLPVVEDGPERLFAVPTASEPTPKAPAGDAPGSKIVSAPSFPVAAHVASPVTVTDEPAASGRLVTGPGAVAETFSPIPERPAAIRASIRPGAILAFVWIAGAAVVLGVQTIRLIRFRRFARSAVESPALGRQAAELATAMGLKSSPRVRLLPGVVSPMLWGVGRRATILFPAALAERLDDDARGSLLVHELAHFGRGDQWVRVLELAAGVLYWWHPAVWLARRGIEAAGEDCADAWVVERFRSRPRCYAAALLDTVDFLASGPTVVVPGVTGLGTAAALRHRLTRIMQGPAPRVLSRPARAALLLLLLTLPLQPALFEMAGSQSLASVSAELDPTELFTPAPTDVTEDIAPGDARLPVRHGEPLAPLPRNHVWAAPSSADGRFTLEVRLDGSATLRDTQDGSPVPLPSTRLTAADFSPDGRSLAVADADGRVILRDIAAESETPLVSPGPIVHSLAFSPAGDRVAVGSDDGVTVLATDGTDASPLPPVGRPAACVRFAADGRGLAVVTGDWASFEGGRVLLRDGADWTPMETGFRAAVTAFAPEGLVVAAWDGRVVLYDLESHAPVGVASVAKDVVSAASFSPSVGGMSNLSFAPEWPMVASGAFPSGPLFGLPAFGASDSAYDLSRRAGPVEEVSPSEEPTGPLFRSVDPSMIYR